MNVYEKLFEMVLPDGFPEPIIGIMKGAVVETVPLEQAEFMLDNAERFDAKFGDGAYRDASDRMQETMRAATLTYMDEQTRGAAGLVEVGMSLVRVIEG